MTPEGAVKDLIKKWLKAHSIPYWMIVPGPLGNSTGIADFVCILPNGRMLAIEAKKFGGKATHIQQKFLDTVNTHGGIAVVVDGEDSLALLQREIYG